MHIGDEIVVKLSEIIEFIENKYGCKLDFPITSRTSFVQIEITKPSDLVPGALDGITFCTEKNANKLDKTNCKIIVTPTSLKNTPDGSKVYLSVADPKSVFIDICDRFFPSRILPTEHIHPTAIVDDKSVILENTRIGAYSIVFESQIGCGCIIHPGVVIYNAQIGNNVIIKPGTVIGYDGFGYYWTGDDQIKKFPHYGKVIIEDDVEIGANTTIDRGALSDTIIRKGTKIDNLVHIAHGDEIGEQVIITAGVVVGGRVKVGRRTWLGIGAVIKQGIHLGKNAFVSMGAVVSKDVSDETQVIGNLAVDRDLFMKNFKKSLEE
jgi:UDP-3-O-[3-hydroxymyristoyl] glucosamine N-acyltransferase